MYGFFKGNARAAIEFSVGTLINCPPLKKSKTEHIRKSSECATVKSKFAIHFNKMPHSNIQLSHRRAMNSFCYVLHYSITITSVLQYL